MEYGEAISSSAAEKAFLIARQHWDSGRRELRTVAAEAVAETYCVCVVDGEDAVEGRISAIHANLIDEIELRLKEYVGEKESV